MKILHVNTYDRGGAANACIRLHLSLLNEGVDSHLLFMTRFTDTDIPHSSVFPSRPYKETPLFKRALYKVFPSLKKIMDRKEDLKSSVLKLVPDTLEWFSFPDTGIDLTTHPLYRSADIINFHWVSDFIDYSFFEKNTKPVVWTLHDMNSFTGGCHYSSGCRGFEDNCMDCPQLQSIYDPNFSSEILDYKIQRLQHDHSTVIVTPSLWLAEETRLSKIFKNKTVLTIPYGIDSAIFNFQDPMTAREMLGLPKNKKIILFVSFYKNTQRKGYSYFMDSLKYLNALSHDTALCIVGGKNEFPATDFECLQIPPVTDVKTMALYYSAADLFVIPSLEDNLPNTVLESLMCGTPVVGFPVGGIKDMVINGVNGYLAKEISSEALAQAIQQFLNSTSIERETIRTLALENYDSPIQARAYQTLYNQLIQ